MFASFVFSQSVKAGIFHEVYLAYAIRRAHDGIVLAQEAAGASGPIDVDGIAPDDEAADEAELLLALACTSGLVCACRLLRAWCCLRGLCRMLEAALMGQLLVKHDGHVMPHKTGPAMRPGMYAWDNSISKTVLCHGCQHVMQQ